MRFFYLLALLTVFIFVSPVQRAFAAVWVEQISGNAQAIVIARKGNFLKVVEMMRLQPGDIIKISNSKASVRVLLGSGAVKSVTKANSPYTVAGKVGGSSFFSNLVGEVKQMLVASSDETEAVAMITRGRSKQVKIIASGAEENMVLASSAKLAIVWHGGKAPYNISLLGSENDTPLVSKAALSASEMIFETGKIGKTGLVSGEYQVVLEATGAKPSTSAELDLLVVERDELPEKARQVLDLNLDKRVEARLLINILHKQPEWRIFAYSLAVHHGLKKERKLLEQMK